MDTTTPLPINFLIFIVAPMLIGALVGALSHRDRVVYGVFIGGIVGALLGYVLMIAISDRG